MSTYSHLPIEYHVVDVSGANERPIAAREIPRLCADSTHVFAVFVEFKRGKRHQILFLLRPSGCEEHCASLEELFNRPKNQVDYLGTGRVWDHHMRFDVVFGIDPDLKLALETSTGMEIQEPNA